MNQIKRLFLSLFFYALSAFGVSLSVKVNVGISAFNGMNVSLSDLIGIKVGTITTILNFTFLLAYMISTKFRYPLKYVLQGVFLLILGVLINFYLYTVLANFEIQSYFLRMLLLSVGTIISGLAVGMIIHYNSITFPIENLCIELEAHTKRSFSFYRYGVDILSILVSLAITLFFGMPLYIREGSILSVLLLTASMNFSRKKMAKVLENETQTTLL